MLTTALSMVISVSTDLPMERPRQREATTTCSRGHSEYVAEPGRNTQRVPRSDPAERTLPSKAWPGDTEGQSRCSPGTVLAPIHPCPGRCVGIPFLHTTVNLGTPGWAWLVLSTVKGHRASYWHKGSGRQEKLRVPKSGGAVEGCIPEKKAHPQATQELQAPLCSPPKYPEVTQSASLFQQEGDAPERTASDTAGAHLLRL